MNIIKNFLHKEKKVLLIIAGVASVFGVVYVSLPIMTCFDGTGRCSDNAEIVIYLEVISLVVVLLMSGIFAANNIFRKCKLSPLPSILLAIVTMIVISALVPVPMRCMTSDMLIPPAPSPDAAPPATPLPPTNAAERHITCFSPSRGEFWKPDRDMFYYWPLGGWSLGEKTKTPPNPNLIYRGGVTHLHLLYSADYSDNTILMGASHNVFVGKVIAQVGNEEFAGMPATQFRVEVITNIKGELEKEIIVNQQGGYENGNLFLVEDGSGLLHPGSTYILATRYDEKRDRYTLNSHENASKLLSTDGSKSNTDLKALADNDEKVKALEAAYPDEKLLNADIDHSNTRNEFKSLSEEKKTAAKARADEAKASLEENTKAQ